MKRFLCVVFVICLIFTACSAEKGNTDESTAMPTETVSAEEDAVKRAFFSVSVQDANEFILDLTEVVIEEDDTVLKVLKKLMKENKIPMETDGNGDVEYVKGINNIYEFDKGPKSGWTFYVNSEMPSEGAGKLKINDGDMISWVYVTDWSEME